LKVQRMDYSVENLCGLLIRSKLLNPDDVKAMYQRWLAEAKEAATNATQFSKWLVAHHYVTEYQAALLVRGQVDDFFLGQYKVLDRLGRGRMAGVYKAVHQLGQVVAIKVLPPSRTKNPQMLGRFQREARLALRLKHPNVVRAFQIGDIHGLHFFVMEYLEGETLEDVLQRRKQLPPAEAVRLIHQALLGLQHIHEKGLVHRDLKPANLMLVPAAPTGGPDTTLRATVKILDIGLGRELFDDAASPAPVQLTKLTGEGVLLGTPDYLAPEQARDPRAIDIRADIYSLGCVLYHLLTGQPPFPDTNVLNQMVRHATERPRPVKELNPAVPDGLQQILNCMLAKDPNQRYLTPEKAAQALKVFLAAGSEGPGLLEEGPQLRKYLTWLETHNNGEGKEAPGLAPVPAAAALTSRQPASQNPAPAAQPVPKPTKPTPVPPTRRPHSKKHKRHKRSAAAKTVKAPAGAVPALLNNPAEEFDVELIPAYLLPSMPSAGRGLRLSKREWIILGIGAGSVIVAVVLGMILALTLS
jgi:serine/threonine protein kinase